MTTGSKNRESLREQLPSTPFEVLVFFKDVFKWFSIFLTSGLTVFTVLLVLVFPVVDTPSFLGQGNGSTRTEITSVSFKEGEKQVFAENYNQSVEEGFCLFGSVNGSEVVVRDVDFVETPMRQSSDSMAFLCRDEILNRSTRLVFDPGYKLVGSVHTHPGGEAELSNPDLYWFGASSLVQRVMGVFDGRDLALYSSANMVYRPVYRDRVVRIGEKKH